MGTKIHINWNGPIPLDEAVSDTYSDSCGVYQYYGSHPVYGSSTLLYIGKSVDSCFPDRLSDHVHHHWSAAPTHIHLGSIVSERLLSDNEWTEQIDLAESILIYTHSPAWNSSNIKTIEYSRFDGVHIFNWGNRGLLLPEISYERWRGTGNLMPSHLRYQSDFS